MLGDHDLTAEDDTNATGYAVLHVKMHEDYDPVTIDNDIALITLERQVEFTDEVYPVCLPKDAQNLFVGEDAKLAGRSARREIVTPQPEGLRAFSAQRKF